jgi:hypothetical protein
MAVAVWLRAFDRIARLRWSFGVASIFDRATVRRIHVEPAIDKGHLMYLCMKAPISYELKV